VDAPRRGESVTSLALLQTGDSIIRRLDDKRRVNAQSTLPTAYLIAAVLLADLLVWLDAAMRLAA
jgi:hypothetical protein